MIWRIIRNSSKKYYGRSLLIVGVLIISILASILLRWMYDNVQQFLFQQAGLYEYDYTVQIKDRWSRWWMVQNEALGNSSFDPVLADPNLGKKYVIFQMNIPWQIQLDLAGQEFSSDIFLFAISDDFFEQSIVSSRMPIAISELMLNLYNTQLADSTILPRITTSSLRLFRVNMIFWQSSVFNIQGPAVTRSARINRVSGILPLGVTVPESEARDIVDTLNDGEVTPYKVIVIVEDESMISYIINTYGDDFVIETNYDQIQKIQQRIVGIKYFFFIINMSIVLVLISFLIYTTFSIVEQNLRSFRVYRLHGAKPWTILMMLLWQISVYVRLAAAVAVGWLYTVFHITIPSLNHLIQDTYGLSFAVSFPYRHTYMWIVLLHWWVFALMLTIFAFPERSKKFENK